MSQHYCVNCAHKKTEGKFFFCIRPSLVTGESQSNTRQSCQDERANVALCGPEGRFWEKEKDK